MKRTVFSYSFGQFRLAVGLIMSIAFYGCSDKQSTTFQGYVEGEFVYIASPIAGRLDNLMVHRGQDITEKMPLFALESTDELAAHRQAMNLLKAAVSQLEDLKTGKRPVELDVVKAQINEAVANEKKSSIQLARDEEQFAAGGIPKSQLDNSRYTHDSDLAKVKEMQSQLASAKLPARDDQIRAQNAQVAAARASLAQAKWRLDQKSIFATKEGLIFDTLYRQGDWVPEGSPIVQMLPPQNIKVRFFVPEKRLAALKLNQKVKIHVDGVKTDVEAVVTYISTQAEFTPPVIYSNETRSKLIFMIEAHPGVDNAPHLHPGQPVEVTVL
jgi:HlyD family secretion protein